MVPRRYLSALVILLAACAQRPAETAPQPLVPKNGPEAHVRVEYEGGVFSRRLQALFSVRRPAFVMVAHLGGDGVIRVLYPEDARESGWVPGGKLYRTAVTSGDYDAAPGYWFMRPTFFRTVGARTDSYDGNGHGFVFIVASSVPLRFDRVSEYGLWNDFELASYATSSDPRAPVRTYANLIAPNGRYTLDFASSRSTWASSTFAQSRMDCAVLSSRFGFTPWLYSNISFHGLVGYPGMWPSTCHSAYDRAYYEYLRSRQRITSSWTGRPTTPASPAPTRPTASPRPIDPRSGRRDRLAPQPGGLGPTRLSYSPTGVTRGFDPTRRTTESGERIYPAPSGWGRGPAAGWPGLPSPRAGHDFAPRYDDRRSESSGSSGSVGSSSSPAASSPSSSGSSGGSRAADVRPGAAEMKGRSP